MPFFTVDLKETPVAVTMAENLHEATEIALHTALVEMMYDLTRDGSDLWDDDVVPQVRCSTGDEIALWAVRLDEALMSREIPAEQVTRWLAVFHRNS